LATVCLDSGGWVVAWQVASLASICCYKKQQQLEYQQEHMALMQVACRSIKKSGYAMHDDNTSQLL
jgi:hypothetical protein